MKKEGAIILLVFFISLLILLTSLSIAEEDPKVKTAYNCLEDKVKDKCPTSVEEQAFVVLATGKCVSELEDKSKDDECWPSSNCRLRDTALAVLALDRIGKSTSDAEDWLFAQKKISKDLIWYLEIVIVSGEEAQCEISYGNTKKTVTVREDHIINAPAGTCLPLATEYDNYWLRVKDTCYEANFTISCDKDFKTTFLYKKKAGEGSDTIYVSSKTNSASAEGETEEKVNSFCFSTSSICDYEGSLWTALALSEEHDISKFLPYLIAMAEDNRKYFPSTFLYIITDYDEYFNNIIDEQKNNFWKIASSPYTKFYDTALALFALYEDNAEQTDNAKEYLLEPGVQDNDGCWNGVRDTAFILYAAWPRSISPGNGGTEDFCEDYEFHCESPLDCEQEDRAGDNFICFGGKVCCKTQTAEETCFDKNGEECDDDEECSGLTVSASDTTKCCVGDCIVKIIEEPECEKENANYNCRSECLDSEEVKDFDCNAEDTCCAPRPSPKPSYWWIYLLIILIILVVLAIIFRNQLRIWLFKIRSKFRKGPAPTRAQPPGFPPTPPRGMPMARPRMIMRRPMPARRPIPTRATSKSDKELEETLKKLKEMSK